MHRTEAQQFVAELCEAVNQGGWGEVLQVGLDNESIEILRVLRQLNGDITKLEAREKELSDALTTRLMPFDFDDGNEPEPAGANASNTNGSAAVEGSKPAAAGYGEPAAPNTSDTRGSALQVEPEPATPTPAPLTRITVFSISCCHLLLQRFPMSVLMANNLIPKRPMRWQLVPICRKPSP